jgi:transposase-like protein
MFHEKIRKEVAVDLKEIYNANNCEIAEVALENFREKWSKKYLTICDIWKRNWQGIILFLAPPDYIRKAVDQESQSRRRGVSRTMRPFLSWYFWHCKMPRKNGQCR